MKRIVLSTIIVLTITGFSNAATLEERVIQLENKVKELEKRIETLEKSKADTTPQQIISKKTQLLKEGIEPISYKLLEKKFKKIEDRLLERDEKIQFVFEITNNFSKQVDTIYGELVVKNKKGEEILRKPVKIYKPLDFFSPGKIKPAETFRRTLEVIYDEQLPNLKYLKDATLTDIKVELIFTKVEFSDGSVEIF